MCGICGFLSRKTISERILERMNNTMYHRGPNDCGVEVVEIGNGMSLGLAQRRLSILDLSYLGHQPMHSFDKRISVVFNGEIYNFKEIREEIKDYSFVSNCDTEVIIAAYLKWGISCISKFNGMFAIALFDRLTDCLYLVRDRMGKKPLYYWVNQDGIVFASECKPIMHVPGFSGRINKTVLKEYLRYGYITSPNSIFENVYKVNPGSILEYRNGIIQIEKYWGHVEKYKENHQNQLLSYQDAKQELCSILSDSVSKRMIADVPVGSFLSGGIDSSIVTAIAQGLYPGNKLKTFSIGFTDNKYNESIYAKQIADYLGTEHTEYCITDVDMLDLVDSIPYYFDEPFADPSEIPTMLVSKLAKEKVTVVLTGDGGDELFCGYPKYQEILKAQKYDYIGERIYKLCSSRLLKSKNLIEKLPYRVRMVAKNRNPNVRTQLFGNEMLDTINKILADNTFDYKYDESTFLLDNWQEELMLLDQQTYLPSILCKVDRASMKYSLECRSPLLDYRVVELSYKIPIQFKYYKRNGKKILKDIAYEFIPRELLDRPKQGFCAPFSKWLRGALKEQLLEYSKEEFITKQGLFIPDAIKIMVGIFLETTDRRLDELIWNYFVFQHWYKNMFISVT